MIEPTVISDARARLGLPARDPADSADLVVTFWSQVGADPELRRPAPGEHVLKVVEIRNGTGRALVYVDGEFQREIVHPTEEFARAVRFGCLNLTFPSKYEGWS